MKYYLPLILSLFAGAFTSCSYVDASVDTTGAVVTQPDGDGDGIPDEITVPSGQIKPALNAEAVNEKLAETIVEATK